MFTLFAVFSLLFGNIAKAGPSSGGDEILSVTEGVPPNILFLIDLSEDMDERTLQSMASDLIAEYKKDKNSRKEWEDLLLAR